MKIDKICLLSLFTSFAFAVHAGNIVATQFGINEQIHHKLQTVDNKLYATSDNGIYYFEPEDNKWIYFSMGGYSVIDFKLSGNTIIARIVDPDIENYKNNVRLVKGDIQGSEFIDITPKEMIEQYHEFIQTGMDALAQHPIDSNFIMIDGNNGLFLSTDFGESWNHIIQQTIGVRYFDDAILCWHPYNPDIRFLKKENAIGGASVYKNVIGNDEGWHAPTLDYYSGGSHVYCICFDPQDENHIFLGGFYCIYESTDCGNSWHRILDEENINLPEIILGSAHYLIYDESEPNPTTIYAIGISPDLTSLNEDEGLYDNLNINIAQSLDNGQNWTRLVSYLIPSDYGVHDVTIFNKELWLYCGDDIYRTDLPTILYSKWDKTSSMESIVSQPSISKTYDLYGREVQNILPGSIYIKDGKKFLAR